ncbi:hypothetical protein Cgig2_001932 [Carnegiea gigantea]|uniref:Uncharacterized protein n=1 Tax=Carnegiea gigantea TaxID=171969 RepID=A0A9Q1JXE0_9CARY|nr:hypothetical protein Cgig2_001932 [Carnegiea gigantea]
MIRLPLRFGDKGKAKNVELDFLVVDVPTAYNIILGRPTPHKLQFEADDGSVGTMQGDQRTAWECYLDPHRPESPPRLLEVWSPHLSPHHSKEGRTLPFRGSGLQSRPVGTPRRSECRPRSSCPPRNQVLISLRPCGGSPCSPRGPSAEKGKRGKKGEYVPPTSATTTSSSVTLIGSEVLKQLELGGKIGCQEVPRACSGASWSFPCSLRNRSGGLRGTSDSLVTESLATSQLVSRLQGGGIPLLSFPLAGAGVEAAASSRLTSVRGHLFLPATGSLLRASSCAVPKGVPAMG